MILKEKQIGVLCGGFSAEREVSLKSGQNVYQALLSLGYRACLIDPVIDCHWVKGLDCVFNALHGKFGEDGGLPAYLDLCQIPYTGSGVQASILSMSKILTKQICLTQGLPTPSFYVAHEPLTVLPDSFSYPVILKPIDEGSSVSVYLVFDDDQLRRDSASIAASKGVYLLEAYISGQEITLSLLETETGLVSLPILELQPKEKFYDFNSKYTPGMTSFVIPALLDSVVADSCHQMAKALFLALGCHGFARVDMIVHPKKGPFILELNSVPGLTDCSDFPAQAQAHGYSFETLMDVIVKYAFS